MASKRPPLVHPRLVRLRHPAQRDPGRPGDFARHCHPRNSGPCSWAKVVVRRTERTSSLEWRCRWERTLGAGQPPRAEAGAARSDACESLYALGVAGQQASHLSNRDRRAAQVAHVLAQAVRAGEVAAADALRILRHELRRRNTNQAQKIATRSTEAQRVIDHYGAAEVPKNASPDALHADHVYSLTEDELRRNDTLDLWISAMDRLRMVVCVTASENYRLETFERAGVTGPDKYARADVTFTTSMLPWRVDPQGALRLSDVPMIDAPWEQIAEFAGTFDGYAHFGENRGERLSAVRERYLATGDLPSDLDDLRGCLFLEFRSDRFTWGDDVMLSEPDEHGVRHIIGNPNFDDSPTQKYRRRIVARIRGLLASSGQKPLHDPDTHC